MKEIIHHRTDVEGEVNDAQRPSGWVAIMEGFDELFENLQND